MNVSSDLIWEVVKKNNSFLVVRKEGTGKVLSKEKGNLYNENSFKYSGLANAKTVDIREAGEYKNVVLGLKSKKKAQNPSNGVTKVTLKKDFRRMVKAVEKQVGEPAFYRPDLKRASVARLSNVHKSLRSKKSS